MMKPIVSVVTGTLPGRIEHLKAMVHSARVSIPRGVPHEFVVVDAGSNEYDLGWMRSQPDVILIEDGEKLGAINAFTRGAYKAQGQYVLLANDDIQFHPESIPSALAYIEDHPRCGAVAFRDNRPIWNGYPKNLYKIQTITCYSPTGAQCNVPYPQVGLIRKELGDYVGWWGMEDQIMREARTYGGDNYLGARLWEIGYTVVDLETCLCDDNVVLDQARMENQNHTLGTNHPDSIAFRRRFPVPPTISEKPEIDHGHKRQLRVLYLPIYEPGHQLQHQTKRGLREALAKRALVYELDYLSEDHPGAALCDVAEYWQPDLLLTQFHDGKHVVADDLKRARAICPKMLILNWNGDALRHDDEAYIELLQQVHLQLVVDGTTLPDYKRFNTPAAYWQIGYEEPLGHEMQVPTHDIAFLGNCYNSQRRSLEMALEGYDVGFYGLGWANSNGQCLYNFDAGQALYQQAKVALGDTFPNTTAFVSNRFFQALAAGAFLLHQEIPEFEKFNPGIIEGEHYVSWRDLEDLREKLDYWLDGRRATKRERIAAAGQEAVQAYSFDAQVGKLFGQILPEVFGGNS